MRHFFAANAAGDLLPRYSFVEPLLSGKRVLEIGAASRTDGASALFLAERGASEVLSIDDEAQGLGRAASAVRNKAIRFKVANISELDKGKFDLVLLAEGTTLAVDEKAVAALRALLAPGGFLVTAIPAAKGLGLSALTGVRPPDRTAPYEAFVGALTTHFPVVEVATQAALVGYLVSPAGVEEPELAIDGSLAGDAEAAYYLAICGDEPSGIDGCALVALPHRPLAERSLEMSDQARQGVAVTEVTETTLSDLRTEALSAREALAEREGWLATLRGEVERLQQEREEAVQALEKMGASLARTEQEKVDAEESLSRLKAKKPSRGKEADEARAALTARIEECKRLTEERDRALVALQEAQTARTAAENAAEASRTHPDVVAAKIKTVEQRAEAEVEKERKRLFKAESELSAARKQLKAREAEIADAGRLQSAAAQTAARERAELQTRLIHLEQEVALLTGERDRAQAQIKAEQERASALEAKLTEQGIRAARADAIESERDQMRAAVAAAEEQRDATLVKLEEAERQAHAARARIQHLEPVCDELRARVQETADELAHLRSEVEGAAARERAAREQARRAASAVDEALARAADAAQAAASAREDAERRGTLHQELEAALTEARALSERVQGEATEARLTAQELAVRLGRAEVEARAASDTLVAERYRARDELGAALMRSEELQAAFDASQLALQESQAKLVEALGQSQREAEAATSEALTAAQTELDRLRGEADRLRAALSQSTSEVKALGRVRDDAEKMAEEARLVAADAARARSEMEGQLQQAEVAREAAEGRARAEAEAAEEARTTAAAVERRASEILGTDTAKQAAELAKVSGQLAETLRQYETTRALLSSTEAERDKLAVQLAGVASPDTLNDLQSELERQRRRAELLEEELDALARGAAEAPELKTSMAAMHGRLEAAKEREKQLQSEVGSLRNEIQQTRDQAEAVAAAEARSSDLAKKLKEAERRLQEAMDHRDTAPALKKKVAALESELTAVKAAHTHQVQQLAQAQQALKEHKEKPTAAPAEVVAKLKEAVARAEKAEAQLKQLAAQKADQRADGAAVRDLEARLAEMAKKLAAAESMAQAATQGPEGARIAQMAAEIQRITKEREELAARYADKDSRLTRLQREIADKTDRIGRLVTEVNELKSKGLGKFFSR
jgi:chromosome segregation ATPase